MANGENREKIRASVDKTAESFGKGITFFRWAPDGENLIVGRDADGNEREGYFLLSRDGTKVDGILSERDIVRSLAVRGVVCMTESVSDMMTRNPVCCARQDTSDAVLTRMTDGRFRHMPVVEDGKLVGIVTIGDVVKARLEELSMEKTALEGMIMGY